MRLPDDRKLPSNIGGRHFISASCGGEACGPCLRAGVQRLASHKLGEEPGHDDPSIRHNLTQYVCCEHFCFIVGKHATCCPT